MIIVLYTDDCLLYARDTKEIDAFVKALRNDYKLTLNDPDPIDDFVGIHFSHQENGELHMIQTGLIDAVTESAHIPKGRLKNTPTPATAIFHAGKEGLTRQESWNYPSLIRQLKFILPFTNAHGFPKKPWPFMKRQLNESFNTCNAQETNHLS
jgi:hypothetical protein